MTTLARSAVEDAGRDIRSASRGTRALVVVPTYNERENLPTLAAEVLAQGDEFHLLVVDDASPDGTGVVADELAAGDARVRVLHRARKEGLGPAYIDGLMHGLADGFDFLLMMDGDHSHDPHDLPRLLAAARDGGADVALGSRWTTGGGTAGWPLHRRFLSRAGSLYVRAALGVPLHDITGGFRCIRRSALEALDITTIRCSGYAFLIELNYRAVLQGQRIVELPILFTERTMGSSKMSSRIVLEAVLRVPLLRLTTRRIMDRAADLRGVGWERRP